MAQKDLLEDLPAISMKGLSTKEMLGVGEKIGFISAGALGGALLRDQVLAARLPNPLHAELAGLALGVIGATVSGTTGSSRPMWLFVGVGVHSGVDILRGLFDRVLGDRGDGDGVGGVGGGGGGGGGGGLPTCPPLLN